MSEQVKARKALPAALLVYFLLTIALVGAVFCYALALPLCVLGRLFPPAGKLGGRITRAGVATLLAVQPWLNARVDIRLPKSCMTIANHRSHLDMFILLSRIPGIRAMAKSSLFRVPFLGVMMWALRHISVKRGDLDSYWQAINEGTDGLRAGDYVHVFPEMTRCSRGFRGTNEFHLAPFRMAISAGVPLVPIAIVGTDEAWPKGVFGVFRAPVRVQSLEPIDPAQFPSAEALRAEARTRIDHYLAQNQ